ncbi:hypothetical protein N9355_04710 [Crocinitomicaceae bacterium]|nr:hypothetical protein [Crocinitomicaceae bacterium]
MDNPIDHPIDLGLVNYTKHPSDPDYVVFRFPDVDRADTFEAFLTSEKIWFERSSEAHKQRTYFLFGLHKTDFKRAERLNMKVEGKHKKPIIPIAGLRWFIVLFGMTAITLAIVGYCKQQEKLSLYDEDGRLINEQTKSE